MLISLICNLALLLVPAAAHWRMSFDMPLSIERLDPILNPGTISGHVHNIAGASNFAPSVTYDELLNSSCTTSPVKQDLSNYWSPQLYYQYPDGTFINVEQPSRPITIYYKQLVNSPAGIKAFPKGFRMIAGTSSLRTFDPKSVEQSYIGFGCFNSALGDAVYSSSLPNTTCPDGLRLEIVFPSCWDGINLDSSDHKSHVAYPTRRSGGLCSNPKYPVALPTIIYKIAYNSGLYSGMWYGDRQPFVLANGDPTGYGFHADFLNGWEIDVLQTAIDKCTSTTDLDPAHCAIFDYDPFGGSGTCVKRPTYAEPVIDQILAALPGCNPVWDGTGLKPTCPSATVPTLNTAAAATSIVSSVMSSLSAKAKPLDAYGAWSYQGCFLDSKMYHILSKQYSPRNLTIQSCISLCQGNDFSYAGLEYGTQCWCGTAVNTTMTTASKLLPSAKCGASCASNSSQSCGFKYYMDLYKLQAGQATFIKSISSTRSATTIKTSTTKLPATTSVSITTKKLSTSTTTRQTATTSTKASVSTSTTSKKSSTSIKTVVSSTITTKIVKSTSTRTSTSTRSSTSSTSVRSTTSVIAKRGAFPKVSETSQASTTIVAKSASTTVTTQPRSGFPK